MDAQFKDADGNINICFACPEGAKQTKLLARVFQENILMLHKIDQPFKVALLFNVHRFPMSQKLHEQVNLGLQFYESSFLDPHFWALIDYVEILRTPTTGQLGVGYSQNTIVRSSFYGIMVFTSENQAAKQCLANLCKDNPLNVEEHPYILHWGFHRTDSSSFLLQQYQQGKDPRLPLFQHSHVGFPVCRLFDDVNIQNVITDVADLKQTKLTLDILTVSNYDRGNKDWASDYKTLAEVEAMVKDFTYTIQDQRGETYGQQENDMKVFINPRSRKSYGHSSQDPLHGWDVTIQSNHENETEFLKAANVACYAIHAHFISAKPLLVFMIQQSINWHDEIATSVAYLQVDCSSVLYRLSDKGTIGWVTMIARGWAAVLHYCPLNTQCQNFLDAINEYNNSNDAERYGYIQKVLVSSLLKAALEEQGIAILPQQGVHDSLPLMIFNKHKGKSKPERDPGDCIRGVIPQKTSLEVMITLLNNPFTAELTVLAMQMEQNLNAWLQTKSDTEVCLEDRVVTVSAPKNFQVLLLTTKSERLAYYLCTKVQNARMKLMENTVTIKFSSRHWELLASDISDRLRHAAILDESAPHQEQHQQQQQQQQPYQ